MDKILHFMVGYIGASGMKVLGFGKKSILLTGFASTVLWEVKRPPVDGWDIVAGMVGISISALVKPSPPLVTGNVEVDREIERIRKAAAKADTTKRLNPR